MPQSMSQHRIVRCEADKPKPLAYLRIFPRARRGLVGYLAAAVIGGGVVIAAVALLALIQSGIGV